MESVFNCLKCANAFERQWELDKHVAATHTRLFTADNHLIVDGMPVWDNDLKVCTVDLSYVSPEPNGDVWFNTKKLDGSRGSLINGERCVTRHPSTGQLAETVWDAAKFERGFGYGLQSESDSSDNTVIQTLFNDWRRTAGFEQSDDRQIEEAVDIVSDMLDECGMIYKQFDATPLANMRAVMQSLVEIVIAQHAIIGALNDTAKDEGF